MTKDRRENERFNQKNNKFEHYDVVNLDNNFHGRIADISAGGMKVETKNKIEIGTKMTATIDLPYKYMSKTSISLEIICRWIKSLGTSGIYHCGFEFLDKSAVDSVFMMKILTLSKKERVLLTLLGSQLDVI